MSKLVALSRQEAALFVTEYIALCEKHRAEVVVNPYGVHTVVLDTGDTFAFSSVYPEWDEPLKAS